ncbi:zinc finger matrin-type protein 5 [Orussus abietinus]|uniref:zinc finger matrin-type protein 5 n=1 Tax=Orussus abietinus TaxID=222816 RepID=UPI0006264172|nr:zinc finger matrin-type protein 5 [Orussus abietinus]
MGKRYFCDYCDRSFKDDPEARKKHLSSLQHAKNRADHYNLYKDPETILKEETAKIPCKRFMTYGDCAFGNGCRFSHYPPPYIWELRRIVESKNRSAGSIGAGPNPDDIVKEFFETTLDESIIEAIDCPIWTIPAEFHNYPNLPPSLHPITPESITNSNFGKWG